MKPRFLPLIALLPLAAPAETRAQSAWVGPGGGQWGDAGNWDPAVPNAIGATANIDTALTVNVSDTGTAGVYPYAFGTLSTTIASGSVVIGSTATGDDSLWAEAAEGSTPVIHVANPAANLFYYANLEGGQGFVKTGGGRLTFRFNGAAQNYTGDIVIAGGILGINQNSSLGNDDNDIFIAGGARLFAEPGPNSGLIVLPASRAITLTGAQSQIGANNANVTLEIEGDILEDAAGRGLLKTDPGRVTLFGSIKYTGETRIAGGTLGLTGLAALPVDQALRFTGANGTLDLGGTSQTVRAVLMDNTAAGTRAVTGGGSLLVTGGTNLTFNGAHNAVCSFSGIESFTYNNPTGTVAMPVVNAAGVTATSTVNLAAAGFDGGTNTLTALSFSVGGGNNDGNNGNLAIFTLGTRNTIHADTVNIGGYAAAGTVLFPAGLASPSLTLRGTDGTSAVTTVKVGETSSGARSGSGTLNLTGGELDARVTNLTIGRHIAGANLGDTSSITMTAGTLVVENLLLAEKVNNGTPTLTSTFTQEGGDVSAGTITLGAGGPQEARLLPTYRLWGGTLAATTIQAGGGSFAANSSRNLILRGGVLENQPGADLAISGITVTVAGNTTTIVGPTAGQKVTLASDVNYSARLNSAAGTSGALVVEGPLDLSAQPVFSIFDDAPGDATLLAPGTKLKLIDYSLGTLTGTFAGLNDGATVTVTKGAVTNTFVIDYDDLGGTAVTLTVPDTGNDYTSWAVDKGIPGEPFDGDFDHDGISNGMEYALGKDPKAPSQPAGQFSGNTITFAKGADAIANRDVSWVIETSSTLAAESWTPEVTQEAGDPATVISYIFTPASPVRKFARLRVEQK